MGEGRPTAKGTGAAGAYRQSGVPEPVTFVRLIEIAEFMLQAPIPPPTRQLLALTVDEVGWGPFGGWLETWHYVVTEPDPDKRLVIREQNQEAWVNGMRATPGPLAAALVAIYDAANAPIASGSPPLTAEAPDAFLEIWVFETAVVEGAVVRFDSGTGELASPTRELMYTTFAMAA